MDVEPIVSDPLPPIYDFDPPEYVRASERPERRDVRWFLHKLVPDAPMSIIYGAPASLKSFLILDWMLHADRGMDWYGHPIAPGRALYVPGEGAAGLHDRIDAWCLYNEVPRTSLDMLISNRINLFRRDEAQIKRLVRQVREEGPVRYVVFDTLHSLSPGSDENSAKDFGIVMETITDTLAALGEGHDLPPRAFLIHHTTKDGKQIRGTSAILGSTDNEYLLKRTGGVHGSSATLYADKVKDAKEPANLTIQFQVQYTGEKDEEGESVTSLVSTGARYTGAQDAVDVWQGMKKAEAIEVYVREHPHATQEEISLATGASQSTVSRTLSKLRKEVTT